MKWIHHINKGDKKFGHSYPLMIVRLMLMVDDLQEVKTIQRSNFENYKDIREGFSADNHKNCIYSRKYPRIRPRVILKNNRRRCYPTPIYGWRQISSHLLSAVQALLLWLLCNGSTTKISLILEKV